MVKSLTAGTYKVHLLSQKEGGKFDAYSVNSAPKNCDGDGKNCSKGWETRYYVKPPYNKVVDNSCSELKNGGCRYESAAQAAANAPEDLVLTLEKDTDVKF